MRPPPSLIGILVSGSFLVSGCGNKNDAAAGGKGGNRDAKIPVLVAEVVRKPMPISLGAIGNVLPQATVLLKPQVTGQIAKIHFQEGHDVKQDDLLFTIDPRPSEVALAKANADLERAKVVASDAERREKNFALLDTGGVSKDEINRIQTDAATARVSVLASETAVASAQLNLDYCNIKAPLAGRTGAVLVDAGNVVQANTTDLVIINQVAPIEVTFSLAEQFLGSVTEYMKKGKLKVFAKPEGKQARKAEGEIVFLNNQVNRAAGTIELKGLFLNEERTLWPGQFVEVEVQLTTEQDRVVTPVRAVQTGQNGQYVFIIKDDMTAAMAPIKMNRSVGDEAVIGEGLNGGEKVVIDGQGQLTEGSKVDIKPALDSLNKPAPEKPKAPALEAPKSEPAQPAVSKEQSLKSTAS